MRSGRFLGVMSVLIFLALVANAVVAVRTGSSWLGEDTLKQLAFWALAAANLCMAGAGIYFTTRTHEKHEKSSIAWGRRAFVVNAAVTLVLMLAPWFFYTVTPRFHRAEAMQEISLILLLFGASNGTFLFSFYREYLRNAGGRAPGPRGRRRAADPHPRDAFGESR